MILVQSSTARHTGIAILHSMHIKNYTCILLVYFSIFSLLLDLINYMAWSSRLSYQKSIVKFISILSSKVQLDLHKIA